MVEMRVNFLLQRQGMTKCVAFVVSFTNLILFWKYGHAISVDEEKSSLQFAHTITPSTTFVLFYFLVLYTFGEKEPGKHPISNQLFSYPFAIFNFVIAVLIFKSKILSVLIDDYNENFKSGFVASGLFYILTAFVLLFDGIVSRPKTCD